MTFMKHRRQSDCIWCYLNVSAMVFIPSSVLETRAEAIIKCRLESCPTESQGQSDNVTTVSNLILISLGQAVIGSSRIQWEATHYQTEKQVSESSHGLTAHLLCPHKGPPLSGWDLLKLSAYLPCHAGTSPCFPLRTVRMFSLKHNSEIISALLARLWCCCWDKVQTP